MQEAPFANVLEGYLSARLNRGRPEADESHFRKSLLTQLIGGFTGAWNQWALAQAGLADDFNLFTVLNVEYDELRHSRLLAWLLDRRIERGTHAQGSRGFELFLKEVGLDLAYARHSYWVRREVTCSQSRVDIEVAARGLFLIHIENKILAEEGDSQTYREWNGLNERCKQLDVEPTNAHGIFLTTDRSKPKSPGFNPIGWSLVAQVFDEFAKEPVMADDVRLFLSHSAAAIRRFAVADILHKETESGETTV